MAAALHNTISYLLSLMTAEAVSNGLRTSNENRLRRNDATASYLI